MANSSSNLPNFEVVRDKFNINGTEIAKIQHVVGVESNTNILVTLERIEQRLVASETRAKASNANTVSRLQNSQIRARDASLAPMLSLRTNSLIAEFPSTPEDISRMTNTELLGVLQELDLDTSGNVLDKKARLRAYVGLTAEAV